DVERRRVNAEQAPWQRVLRQGALGGAHHDGRAAHAAMRARIGQEISLSLEAETEGRREHRSAHDGRVMQSVVKAERKADNEQRRTNLDVLDRVHEVGGIESVVDGRLRQSGAVNLDRRDVDLSGRVEALTPDGLAAAIQRDRKTGGHGHVLGIIVELDLQAVREMTARFVFHDVPARDQEQAFIAFEKKAARIRQRPLLLEGANPRRSEQERVDQRILLPSLVSSFEAARIVERNLYHAQGHESPQRNAAWIEACRSRRTFQAPSRPRAQAKPGRHVSTAAGLKLSGIARIISSRDRTRSDRPKRRSSLARPARRGIATPFPPPYRGA